MPTMDVAEAVAREAIRDLVARYNANGDTGRFEQLMELFATDAVMELDDGLYNGHDEILTIFTGAQQQWAVDLNPAGASNATHHVRHTVSTHQIDFEDPTHASGYSYYSVIMPHGLDHWGRYFDRYEERDGRWLFTRRKVTLEGRTTSG
jgi:hypothetical protein